MELHKIEPKKHIGKKQFHNKNIENMARGFLAGLKAFFHWVDEWYDLHMDILKLEIKVLEKKIKDQS